MEPLYETFKKTKDVKKNDKYGVKHSGNTGKNFYNRSFGGAMSNRKYTKEQVKPHKLKKSIGTVSPNVKDKKIIPPLYPVSDASSQKGYRTGYLSNDKHKMKKPSELTKYYQPMQNMDKDNSSNANNIKITNINNDKNVQDGGNNNSNNGYNGYNDGYNGINNGYNWYYGGYGTPNWYNPYYYGSYLPWMPPYQDEQQPVIINNIPSEENKKMPYPMPHYGMTCLIIIIIVLIILLFIKK